jgi:hypothetical protein
LPWLSYQQRALVGMMWQMPPWAQG